MGLLCWRFEDCQPAGGALLCCAGGGARVARLGRRPAQPSPLWGRRAAALLCLLGVASPHARTAICGTRACLAAASSRGCCQPLLRPRGWLPLCSCIAASTSLTPLLTGSICLPALSWRRCLALPRPFPPCRARVHGVIQQVRDGQPQRRGGCARRVCGGSGVHCFRCPLPARSLPPSPASSLALPPCPLPAPPPLSPPS